MQSKKEKYVRQAQIFKNISHPLRLEMLVFLTETGGAFVHEIIDNLNVAQSIVSQHLSKLRAAGIVKDERFGTKIRYTVQDDLVKSVLDIL